MKISSVATALIFLPVVAYAEAPKKPVNLASNGEAALLYSTSGQRDSWCTKRAHFCIGANEKNAVFNITKKFLAPAQGNFFEDKGQGNCISRRFHKGTKGKIVYLKSWKTKERSAACQPLPKDGAKSYVIAFEPGKKHRQNLIAESTYPVEFLGAPRPKKGERDMRPVINCRDTIKARNTVRAKACNGLLRGTELTIDGFVVIAGNKDASGKWQIAGGKIYRCFLGNLEKLIVRNVDAKACPHGIQGTRVMAARTKANASDEWFQNGEWGIYDSRFTDCSPRGYGKMHCIYSSSPHAMVKIRRFYGTSCGGHVVKSNSRLLDMENFYAADISSKKCNVNSPIHNNSGRTVRLINGTIVQNKQPKNTNYAIFTSGGKTKKGYRCTGKTNGDWYLKNIKVSDFEDKNYSPEQNEYYRARYKFHCKHLPKPTFKDGGGNIFVWLNKEPIPLIPVLEIESRPPADKSSLGYKLNRLLK